MQSLSELTGSNTKQEVLGHIQDLGYYFLTRHDLPPYPGQAESRYHTLLAWARKDCVEREFILSHERDAWALSIRGRSHIEKMRQLSAAQTFDVRKCYLWTEKFKRKMDQNYRPSSVDAERPEIILDEMIKFFEREMKKEPNQAPEPTAAAGRGSS